MAQRHVEPSTAEKEEVSKPPEAKRRRADVNAEKDSEEMVPLPPYALELDRTFYAFVATCALFYARDHVVCTWNRLQAPFIGLVGRPLTSDLLRHFKILAGDAFNVGWVMVPRDSIAGHINVFEPSAVSGIQQDLAIYLATRSSSRAATGYATSI